MKKIYLALLLALSLKASAQVSVWSTDVAPIIYNRCANCHRSGGIAPFSLTSFNDAIANSGSMGAAVQSGAMPPWPPDPFYNHLAHERVLSAGEKSKILSWLNGGMPRGNPSLEPPVPTFPNTGDLPGTPDLVLKMPAYTSTAAGNDVYRCFVLPTGLSADKFITAFECIPGNRAIVHHVLVYADTTGVSTTLDGQDPAPGYTCFSGVGTNDAVLLGGWVPGSSPTIAASGFGFRLSRNAKIVLQIHYPSGTSGMQDSTEIHLFFSPTNNVRSLMVTPVLNHGNNINAPLNIPANTVKQFTEHQLIPFNYTLFGVMPHMHLIGTQIASFCVAPAGDTQRFISIPHWDFHWQGMYGLRHAMKIAAGSTIYANATYDNTVNNPSNPSSPPQNVKAGESTTDEMMLVYFMFAAYQAGDENIVLDTSAVVGISNTGAYYKNAELLQPYPVPASSQLVVKYFLATSANGSLVLTNMAGQPVQTIASGSLSPGYSAQTIDVGTLPDGIYLLRLVADGHTQTIPVTIRH